MTPTIFRTRNLRVVVYPKDHLPPHVHVIGPDGVEAKFDIATLRCMWFKGFSHKDLRRIRNYLRDKTNLLMEYWDEYQD